MGKYKSVLILALILAFIVITPKMGAAQQIIKRDMWSYDAAEWGDGRFTYDIEAAKAAKKPAPASGWIEYNFEVPKTGWYTLWFKKWGGLTHEVIVDGKLVYFGGIIGWPGQKLPRDKNYVKSANLPLTAGKHTLRIQRLGRVGFPKGFPSGWELREVQNQPNSTVSARIKGFDVIRVGEELELEIRGGCSPKATTYEISIEDLLKKTTEKITTVSFPVSKNFITKNIKIRGTREGVFQLRAKTMGIDLLPSEFRGGKYAVINTKNCPKPGKPETKLLKDIDCVKQTINGKPVAEGNFIECNGKTTVVNSKLGPYRETNDGRGPDIAEPTKPYNGKNFSGFSYKMKLAEGDGPYLIEVDYPDNDWRHINFMVADFDDPKDLPKGKKGRGYHPPSGGVFCGGVLPLSNTMHTYRGVFWTNFPTVLVSVVSQRVGFRAAASRIRISKFTGSLTPYSTNRDDGRIYLSWHEQADDWDMTVGIAGIRNTRPNIVNDYIGLKRWVEVAAYTGMNGIGPSDVSYQGAYYRARVLKGFMPREYDMVRMTALLCEKYGMKYIPCTFFTQAYWRLMVMKRLTENPDDVTTFSFQGLRGGKDVRWQTMNVLHPAVQDKLVEAWGELSDKLRDSPAFAGISARYWSWIWQADWAINSIFWGYGDWTVRQFSKDTGINVPGNSDDPNRFQERFAFLTGNKMRSKWMKWRTDNVMSFYERLRDRIRGNRKDITVFFSGTRTVDTVYNEKAQGATTKDRFMGMGVDLDKLKQLDGVALLPIFSPGRGKARTPLTEQEWYDKILDPEFKARGFNQVRAIQFSPQYDEWGKTFPLERLGMPLDKLKGRLGHYCTTSTATDRYDLERSAIALADMDCMIIWDGSFRANHGIREIRGPWLAEYKQIPRVPFTSLAEARDPIAVWYKNYRGLTDKGRSKGFYFYAVNKERYSAVITLELSGAKTVTRLGTGEKLKLVDGKLILKLKPFELIAFQARARTKITGAKTDIPPEQIVLVKNRLAFAQEIAGEITVGTRKIDFTDEERQEYLKNLEAAWNAFKNNHYWRARTALSMAQMMEVYQKCGKMPAGQYVTAFPRMLSKIAAGRYEPDEPYLDADQLQKRLVNPAGTVNIDSGKYNTDWKYVKVLKCDSGKMEIKLDVPAQGPYQLSIGHVAETCGPLLVSLGGKRMPIPAQISQANTPEYTVFPVTSLPGGTTTVRINSAGSFGIYCLKLVPGLKNIPSNLWSVIGPFKSAWDRGRATNEFIKQGFEYQYPPDKEINLNASYKNAYGNVLKWNQVKENYGNLEDMGPNFSIRSRSAKHDFCFAVTYIKSPDDRNAQIFLAPDWWSDLFVNGKKIESDLPAKVKEKIAANFTTWKPRGVTVSLKKGWNTVMVKTMGGSLGSSLCAIISDQKDLEFSPVPQK